MASYSLFICRSAEKELLAAPKADRQRLIARIRKLASCPRPAGCEKLKGDISYRIRQGDYRIVYTIDDANRSLSVDKVGHHREVYR